MATSGMCSGTRWRQHSVQEVTPYFTAPTITSTNHSMPSSSRQQIGSAGYTRQLIIAVFRCVPAGKFENTNSLILASPVPVAFLSPLMTEVLLEHTILPSCLVCHSPSPKHPLHGTNWQLTKHCFVLRPLPRVHWVQQTTWKDSGQGMAMRNFSLSCNCYLTGKTTSLHGRSPSVVGTSTLGSALRFTTRGSGLSHSSHPLPSTIQHLVGLH